MGDVSRMSAAARFIAAFNPELVAAATLQPGDQLTVRSVGLGTNDSHVVQLQATLADRQGQTYDVVLEDELFDADFIEDAEILDRLGPILPAEEIERRIREIVDNPAWEPPADAQPVSGLPTVPPVDPLLTAMVAANLPIHGLELHLPYPEGRQRSPGDRLDLQDLLPTLPGPRWAKIRSITSSSAEDFQRVYVQILPPENHG